MPRPTPPFRGLEKTGLVGGDPCQVPTVRACCFPGRRPLAWLRSVQVLPSPLPRPSALVLGWVGDVRLWEHEVIQPSLLSGFPDIPRVTLCGGQAEWYAAGPLCAGIVLGSLIQLRLRSKGPLGTWSCLGPSQGLYFPFLKSLN